MRIYIGNFAFESTEQRIRELFEPFGRVEEVTIVQDRYSGRSKGFGFVEMPTGDEAQAAIDGLNGNEIDGRTITVNEARPRTERSFGGGGGGGGNGGGGGGNGGGGGAGGGRGPRW
ncbi:MAG: RNA recognition motif-containing protein [Chloroflexi bacterium]|nr:MAG: RNA recognition motif-containing protein [Chloroflexota bacterium]